MPTINKQACPTCGQSVNERKIALFKGMVDALARVFKWCVQHNKYEFTRKEIKHLLYSDNEIARFGDWVHFGMLEKIEKGHYKIKANEVSMFLQGMLKIPKWVWKNPLTKEMRPENYVSIYDIPELRHLVTETSEYIVEYRKRLQTLSQQRFL